MWSWSDSINPLSWDRELVELGGHPLQTWLWGEARLQAENIMYKCYRAVEGNKLKALARVETRHVPMLGNVAWIPKGPVYVSVNDIRPGVPESLANHLRNEGFILCASSPWIERLNNSDTYSNTRCPWTIWIDLKVGKKKLLDNLNKQWKYHASKALRHGIIIELSDCLEDVPGFYSLCKNVSDSKGFELPGSQLLMEKLLALSGKNEFVCPRLFLAKYDNKLCAGLFVIRTGKHIHYMWGGMSREHSRLKPSEAVQWAVMEWAVENGCQLYDLEGIDPVNNPGTYDFKKRMGGREVALMPMDVRPLKLRGRLISMLLKNK